MIIPLRDKAFYSSLLSLAVPVALQNIINAGVGLTDNLMVGRLGETQLAAVALANQPFYIILLLFFGLGSGAGVLNAQYWGKKELPPIEKAIALSLRLSLAVGLAASLAVIIWPGQIMALFSSDPAVIDCGIPYLRIVGSSYIFSSFTVTYLICLRSLEKAAIPFYIYGISLALNIFLNWVLIYGNLGAPRMEVVGAAIATFIARLLEALMALIYGRHFNNHLRFRIRSLWQKSGILARDFYHYSGPVIFNEFLWGLGISLQVLLLGRLSSEAVAANAIARNLQYISSVAMLGIANASAVLIGKEIGAGQEQRARNVAATLTLWSFVLGLIAAGLMILVRPLIFSFYDLTYDTRHYLNIMLLMMALYSFLQGPNCTCIIGILRGGGDTRFALVLDVGVLWGVSLLFGFLGGFVFGWPVLIIYAILVSDELLKFIPGLLRLKSDRWLHNVTRDTAE
ncbi:MAG: MATE family efflux transporter [Clostridiales bacterium]|nr:MATE family efflux transporter [Clostridiales bacterium]